MRPPNGSDKPGYEAADHSCTTTVAGTHLETGAPCLKWKPKDIPGASDGLKNASEALGGTCRAQFNEMRS